MFFMVSDFEQRLNLHRLQLTVLITHFRTAVVRKYNFLPNEEGCYVNFHNEQALNILYR